MKTKRLFLPIFGLIIVFLLVENSYSITNTRFDYILTNISKITAGNIGISGVSKSTQTNRTAKIWGIALSVSACSPGLSTAGTQRIANTAVARWTVMLTNRGNDTEGFKIMLDSVSSNAGTLPWQKYSSITNINFLSAGNVTNFTVTIDPSDLELDANWFAMRIIVQATNTNVPAAGGAKQARRYLGIGLNGTYQYFGGWIGYRWDQQPSAGSATNNRAFIQNNETLGATPVVNSEGFMVAVIKGPQLQISKSIVDIYHPAAYWTGNYWAEPGALITYVIFATNKGSGTATNARLYDMIPLQLAFSNTVISNQVASGGENWFRQDSLAVGASGSDVVYTNVGFKNEASVRIKIKVYVK